MKNNLEEVSLVLSRTKGQNNSHKVNPILYTDNLKDNDLIECISKTQQQRLNCLDLSKRNIQEFPSQLLQFTSLQVNHF